MEDGGRGHLVCARGALGNILATLQWVRRMGNTALASSGPSNGGAKLVTTLPLGSLHHWTVLRPPIG